MARLRQVALLPLCSRPQNETTGRSEARCACQVVLQLPSCLRCGPVSQTEEDACAGAVMQACAATAPLSCFRDAVQRCAASRQRAVGGSQPLGCAACTGCAAEPVRAAEHVRDRVNLPSQCGRCWLLLSTASQCA